MVAECDQEGCMLSIIDCHVKCSCFIFLCQPQHYGVSFSTMHLLNSKCPQFCQLLSLFQLIFFLLILQGLEVVNVALCKYFQGTYINLRRKINFVMRLVELYKPYLFFGGMYVYAFTLVLVFAKLTIFFFFFLQYILI